MNREFQTPSAVLTHEVLDAQSVSRAAEETLAGGAGAIVTFVGTVRDHAKGPDKEIHQVDYLEYSAYEPMALSEMQRIADEVKTRWNLPCAIAHRLGKLGIGEASVIIAVASAHRAVAFEACHWAIDEVKVRVPIWKKEVAKDGIWWVEDPISGQIKTSQNNN
jgi:molybdopterin synthase catalytic subunit